MSSGTYSERCVFACTLTAKTLSRRLPKAPLDLILLGERLDDVDADDRLLRHGRDVGELLLHVAQDGVRDVAVAVGDADEERRDRERDQRQLPVVEEEDDRDADDRDHVLGEEDQPVAEEEADRLQVDGRARHQLAGLVPVEVAEREPQQARVERIAHVPLDRDRLLAGDEAPAEHQHRAQEADAEDAEDQERELVAVLAAAELVDHEAR